MADPSPTVVDPSEPPKVDTSALQTAFSTAHHDIWWAKGHAWTVSNWAIAGIAGLAGLAHFKVEGALLFAPWLVAIAINGLCLLATSYIARMQADMVESRLRADIILDHHERLKALLAETTKGMPADPNRGHWFMRVLTLLVSLTAGAATYAAYQALTLSIVIAASQASIAWILVAYLPCSRLLRFYRE